MDNTSDLGKPVSTATQTALDLKEDKSNKSTSTTLGTSNILYPSQNAVKVYVDDAVVSGAPDATTTTKGKVQLAGDLGGTAASPTVPGLLLKRDKTEIGDAHGFINPPNSGNFTVSNTGSSVTVNLLSNAGNYKLNGTDYVNNGLTLTFTASLGQNQICINSSGLVVSSFDIIDLTKIPCCTIN